MYCADQLVGTWKTRKESNRSYMYNHCSRCFITNRRAVQKRIDDEYASHRASLKHLLSKAESVAVTMDIWSDNTMRGFLGLTVHFLNNDALATRVLDVPRFKGK